MSADYDCVVCGCTSFSGTEAGSWACDECGQEYWRPANPFAGAPTEQEQP